MLAAMCVAGLLAGTVAAMAYTQHLRKEGPIATEIRFKDKGGNGIPPFRVCFRLPREDTVDVEIVTVSGQVLETGAAEGDLVATLADGERLAGEYEPHCFTWDGFSDRPLGIAGEGLYRVRITLRDADRSGVSGEKIRIKAPRGDTDDFDPVVP